MAEKPDINPTHLKIVTDILHEILPQDVTVWVFGSRAKWTAKEYSDLDLALEGKNGGKIPTDIIASLDNDFEDSDLPWKVDVVDINAVAPSFREIIMRDRVKLEGSENRSNKTSGGLGISSEWTQTTIREVGQVFDGPHATPKTIDQGPIFLGIKSLNYGRLDLTNTRHVTDNDYRKWTKRVIPQKDDIVFSYETRIGDVAIIPEGLTCCLGRRMGLIRLDRSKVLPTFFLYHYLSPQFQQFLKENTIPGATVDRLLLTKFPDYPVPIPPLDTQERIACILGNLDQKIELNQRMNKTLEEMAQAIFKCWFVDFEPTRAKIAQKEGSGESNADICTRLKITPKTLSLFPNTLTDSELGPIPEGWEVKRFSETINIWSGGTPKTKIEEYWNGDIPWFSVVDAPAPGDIFVITTEKSISKSGLENSATKLLPVGTTIISARGTVGKLALTAKPMTMNQSCYGLEGKKEFGPYFNYINCCLLVQQLQGLSHGSVFDTITRATFGNVECIVPPSGVLRIFHKITSPIFERVVANLNQSHILAQIRDTLLPKLLSGEISVGEAENIMEVM